MKVSVTYSEIWRISWPIMLSSLANTVINFTDVAFVARIGETALAASALGGVFYFLFVMLGVAIGIGSQILIARRAGEERHSEIGEVFDMSMLVLLLVSLLMVVFIYSLVPIWVPSIVHDPAVAEMVVQYLFARGWGIVFMMILVGMRSFYTGITLTRIITYTTVVMMLLNIVLNYAFVLGGFGVTPMGIAGSGLASALSETVAAIYAILYTMNRSILKEYNLFRFTKIRFEGFKQLMVLSSPIILQHFLSMGAWFLFFLMIEKLGARELAVSNVVRSIYMVLMTPVWGFSQASNSMVSNLIGQGRSEDVMDMVRKIVRMSFGVGVLSIVLSVVFKTVLFDLSTSDAVIAANATGSFYMICLATLFFSVSMVMLTAVSGTGSTTAAMVIELISLAVYVGYLMFFTVYFPQPVVVVWGAEVAYWLLLGVVSYIYLRSGKWKLTALKYN